MGQQATTWMGAALQTLHRNLVTSPNGSQSAHFDACFGLRLLERIRLPAKDCRSALTSTWTC